MTNIGIKERRAGTVTILDADGNARIGLRFGGGTVNLPRAVQSLLEEGQNQILLNLSGVTFIDSSVLRDLAVIHIEARGNGGQIKLLHLTEKLQNLMTIEKLPIVFEVYQNEFQGVDSFTIKKVETKHVLPEESKK